MMPTSTMHRRIIAVGSPEKGFIQGFDRVFPEFRKTRLGFRCKNRFFELLFFFFQSPSFPCRFYVIPCYFLEESTGFYLNYVGFKHTIGGPLVMLEFMGHISGTMWDLNLFPL